MKQVAEWAWLLRFDDPEERVANARARAAAALLASSAPAGRGNTRSPEQ